MKKFIYFLSIIFLTAIVSSCGKDEPKPPVNPVPDDPSVIKPDPENPGSDTEQRRRTILVYAVASNNLASDFNDDCEEMLTGMNGIDNERYTLLLYRVLRSGAVDLLEATFHNTGYEFESIKQYDNKTLSTDPDRLSEVIEDVKSLRPAEEYGLIFWAHGSSWEPTFSDHNKSQEDVENLPVFYAYGGDQTTGVTDWMDIDEMARALPDGEFEFIWFDNCFMSSIEVIYQLRNKAKYLAAYPTEIYSFGAPYHSAIPLLMQDKYDLRGALYETFYFYNFQDMACTVALMDLSKIEKVADLCRIAYTDYELPDTSGLQVYSRFSYGPYFDFAQLTKVIAKQNGNFSVYEFEKAMDEFVIYKDCSRLNFSRKPIDPGNYSGISAHAYKVYTQNDDYYRSLDWYKRVFNGQ